MDNTTNKLNKNMRKINNKVKKMISCNKITYDIIKQYCDDNSLVLSCWLEKIALQEIKRLTFRDNVIKYYKEIYKTSSKSHIGNY